ncbi:MAG: flagellar hook-basal body protein [Chloroflexi bacterium]|nr:flagellar hook-basal body protein [Chloroflexota bacterium]
MIKGIYSAFNAMEAAWKYQDSLANNIANAGTAGFKREIGAQQSFADILLSQRTPIPAPFAARVEAIVGQIGSGTFLAELTTDFTNGELQPTNGEFDFALDQGFFAAQDEQGRVFYTRGGRFGRDSAGDLVTSRGDRVLDENGATINLPPGAVHVGLDGVIAIAGQDVARLGVFDFTPNQLVRAGEAHFTSATPGTLLDGGVRQGFIEGSNSQVGEELTTMLAVTRTFQANQTVLARLDASLQQAATDIGQL